VSETFYLYAGERVFDPQGGEKGGVISKKNGHGKGPVGRACETTITARALHVDCGGRGPPIEGGRKRDGSPEGQAIMPKKEKVLQTKREKPIFRNMKYMFAAREEKEDPLGARRERNAKGTAPLEGYSRERRIARKALATKKFNRLRPHLKKTADDWEALTYLLRNVNLEGEGKQILKARRLRAEYLNLSKKIGSEFFLRT